MKGATLLPPTVAGAGLLAATAVLLPHDAVVAAVIPGTPGSEPRDFGLLALAVVGCCVAFTVWPWMVLPTAIVGVLGTTAVLGDSSVRSILGLHGFLLAAGAVSLVIRRLVLVKEERRVRTVIDLPMLLVVVLLGAAAAYGLILGSPPAKVMISGYHFAVIPIYYFMATYTLTTPSRVRSAGSLFVVLSAALTIVTLASPGRHGGAWSLIAALPLLVLSCRTEGWRRVGLVALAALYLVDVVLASYRTTWVLAGAAVLVLLTGGTGAVRRAAGAMTAAAALLLVGAIMLSEGVRNRSAEITTALGQGAGYRLPEATVGIDAFLSNPLVGLGLGHSTPDVYLPDFKVTDVGPLYHVFYVMILANLGLVGLVLLLWPILRAVREGLVDRDGLPFAFTALICGFLVSVIFSGPATGHWALGLLPALVFLTRQPGGIAVPTPRTWATNTAPSTAGNTAPSPATPVGAR
ncbi:O-antigen ligase family protein [Micromonospora sp. NPDC004704]